MTEFNRRDVICMLAAGAVGVVGIASTAEAAVPHGHRRHSTKGSIAMTKELGEFTIEHFETLVGENFVINGQEARLLTVRRGLATPARFREPFSLSFATPAGTTIRSEVVPVFHPAIGRHDLLVTQVIDSEQPTALEICFG
jgi:hypothetical protein